MVPVANSLDVAVFDQQLQLVSEKQVGALTGPGDYDQGYVSLVLADMNGDGKLDVVAEYELGLSGEGGGVQVFYGDGSGGFQPAGGFGSRVHLWLNGGCRPEWRRQAGYCCWHWSPAGQAELVRCKPGHCVGQGRWNLRDFHTPHSKRGSGCDRHCGSQRRRKERSRLLDQSRDNQRAYPERGGGRIGPCRRDLLAAGRHPCEYSFDTCTLRKYWYVWRYSGRGHER